MTQLFIEITIIIIIVYDFYAVYSGGMKNTISHLIYSSSYKKPYGAFIPLLTGMLVYHLLIGR